MSTILQLLVYGLQLGSVYALLALGYTMVYGTVRLINMAHGDFLMIGAMGTFFLSQAFVGFQSGGVYSALAVVAMIAIAMIGSGLIGVATEAIAYRPVRGKSGLTTMITALGVSMFLENFPRALPFIGPTPRAFPTLFPKTQFEVGGVTITSTQIIMICLSVVMMLMLLFIVNKTSIGRKMRAVSMDKDASALMGININQIISITFFIGAALAAASGIFYSSVYPQVQVYMGSWLGQKAFIAAVLGGIGDIRGAVIGGYIMGITEIYATALNSGLGYAVAFLILIIILLVKPAGIMGKLTIEKV